MRFWNSDFKNLVGWIYIGIKVYPAGGLEA
jgi:hypothetical protein